jgi:hypothetical protein
MPRKPIIDRAFELAESGQCRIPSEIKRALLAEGYTQADAYALEGKLTRSQLMARCSENWISSAKRFAPASRVDVAPLIAPEIEAQD